MDGSGAPGPVTDIYAPEDVLEIKEVTDYIQRAFNVFELDRAHDWRNIYSYICYSIAEEWRTALPKEDSAKGHFKLVNRAGRGRWTKRVSKDAEERDYYSISLNLSDTIWVLAGVHVLLNHQKINIVEKNLAALKIDVSSKIVRNLLDYCVDCSLRLFGDRLSSQALDYMNKYSREREDPEFGKMSNSEVRRSVLKHYKDDSLDPHLQDAGKQMEFKNFYMGALLSACAGRTTPFTNILYFGFIHYDDERDILFCVDHDTGLLRGVSELLRVRNHEGGVYRVAHRDLQNALRNMFKSTCNDDTRLVNINIDEVAEFDVLPCNVYHWVGEWYEKRDINKIPRRRLPDVLCSALDRFLYVLNNPDLVRQDPFWNFDEDCYGDNWFSTVIWKYPESQWTLFSDRYCNLAFNFTTTPRKTIAIDETELKSCVPISEMVERYVSDVTLQSNRHATRSEKLDRIQTRMDKYSNDWLNSVRHGAQYFNFEFMERPVNESILENYQFKTPSKSLDTIKALFYVFVFKRIKDVMKDETTHSLDMTAREEIFEKYWTYFYRNAYDFIKQHVNSEGGDDDDDGGLNGEQQQQLVDEIVYKQEVHSPDANKRQRTA